MTDKRQFLHFNFKKDISIYLLWALVILFFAITVVYPLFCLALTPTAHDFFAVLTSKVWHTAILNTALECICSTTLSVATGYIFAYAVVRGQIPLAKFFGAIPILHLVTPPFVGGLSFILLLGRRGFITSTILGLDISLYGFWGLLIAQVFCFFPIAYLICSQTLKGINPSFEQAARGMGASRARIFLTITLPLSLPGILSAALFIAVSVLSDFGNPMIVAGRFKVLAVEIYTQLTGWTNAGTSAVLGLILVIPSIILFIFQNRLVKKEAGKTATIGGKGQGLPQKKSSIITKIFLTIFCALVSLAVLAQFAALVAGAFQKLWGIKTDFTTEHIKSIFNYIPELRNSILFALAASLLSVFVSSLTSYLVQRTALPAKRFLDVVSQLAAAIPGSLFGLAFSLAANKLNFRNSPTMIVIAIAIGFMPFSYRILTSSFVQIKNTLDDGASSLGAGKLKILTSILIPISTEGIFSAFIYNFVRGVGTMSAVIFLVSFKTPLTSLKILNLAEEGFWGKAASLSLVLTLLTFAVLGLGKLLLKIRRTSWKIKSGSN
ncbi:ABC transporter permease [Treponema zioleckii]|uniref:ABC transporter permease n=1 Tax=Treponema zioleckii TaxID=331680 RepID=UPI00168B843B|nr:iron ABC transporter permease [Treponema zioleckii]